MGRQLLIVLWLLVASVATVEARSMTGFRGVAVSIDWGEAVSQSGGVQVSGLPYPERIEKDPSSYVDMSDTMSSFRSVTVTKPQDEASPMLLKRYRSEERLSLVVMTVRDSETGAIAKFRLRDVVVSSRSFINGIFCAKGASFKSGEKCELITLQPKTIELIESA